MIKIEFSKSSLLVSGHANFAPKGKDIVCAAVSALVTGSAEIWKDLPFVKISVKKNSYSFQFLERDEKLDWELKFLLRHLKIIASNYPKCVKFIWEE
ncbi:hypothetical protein MHC_04275 [Mycoplasma haemocanis str. Illinois]|uniref:Ribosomal processing cysteine protease Prp n=1 Tax=Mycoplasma haemocanis (strain Illinois) TaxID=1111676 RepID=H6N7T9_MYCHN|nr:ribosomal-processing cysteine protease Prp [Mycoplasma haemocanis]AEW45711.1 hypothetical protein MHC_04275 [Mycoplasma haemocanis str. Illinois]